MGGYARVVPQDFASAWWKIRVESWDGVIREGTYTRHREPPLSELELMDFIQALLEAEVTEDAEETSDSE